jgi:hypothetical protein
MSDVLTPEEAIRAMLDGEVLICGEHDNWFDGSYFGYGDHATKNAYGRLSIFYGLCRKPVKKTRLMTREEALAWSVSGESLGYVVKCNHDDWTPPQCWRCFGDVANWRRARIAPDGTISDEQGFEVEVVE